MVNIQRVDNHLEDRARLIFVFYEGEKQIVRILSFFENIQVRESQKSNLVDHHPLSRAGTLFSYVGAESRRFTVTFNITLPNIIAAANRNYKRLSGDKGKLREQRRFFNKVLDDAKPSSNFFSKAHSTADYDFIYKFEHLSEKELKEYEKYVTERDSPLYNEVSLRNSAIDTIVYWVNLIRTSVVNDATNPVNGPPIIRLNFGTMYRDVPCVCRSYTIDANDANGYDVKTLLPRVINVQLELQEIRTGDFTRFRYGEPIKRDNLTGWESVVDPTAGSMDPGELGVGASIIGSLGKIINEFVRPGGNLL